ncbi:MAG TPA: 3' terminal RNA ribose 2'-O-methyltransferase Hen1, partial [Dehalococcoidia bacterium]|nr:3' terminal RNA ribose 2'-O-methyltransferase Hen1 [Dehalococcoidia bacterium]
PEMLEKLFAPLGWQVSAESQDLDLAFPSWGPGYYYTVTLTGAARLQDALRQLYVLLPVLDGGKHYALSDAEADKLARLGAGWLEAHPERDYIAARFLRHRKGLIEQALSALQESVEPDPLGAEEPAKQPLGRLRYETIVTTVKDSGAKSVLDLGCGEGKLLFELAKHPFERLVGADASLFQLRRARWLTRRDKRIQLLQSCLTYQDSRLRDYDAAILCEVIEHINPERLPALEASIFGFAHPKLVIVTTPNREYNVLYEKLDGKLRHKDHRFEWTRSEFESWAKSVANKHDYEVTFQGIGEADATRGAPTQMAVFHA